MDCPHVAPARPLAYCPSRQARPLLCLTDTFGERFRRSAFDSGRRATPLFNSPPSIIAASEPWKRTEVVAGRMGIISQQTLGAELTGLRYEKWKSCGLVHSRPLQLVERTPLGRPERAHGLAGEPKGQDICPYPHKPITAGFWFS
jgi:hypothetical protein